MNRALFRLSLACLAMFVLLLLNVNYVQAFEASSLASKPGNIRTFDQQFQYQRGSIIATGGPGPPVKIAESVPAKGSSTVSPVFHRDYPYGPVYAPVTGFDSVYGSTGIEAAEDKNLSGTASGLTVHNLISLLTGKPKQGATVSLTISAKAQQAAYQGLLGELSQGHDAAAVAINPTTGAILALASVPTFDPNRLTTLDGAKFDKIDHQLLANPAQPLLNRAINATYPPGSSFKVVTSSAAFSTGKVAGPTATVSAPQPLTLPNGNLLNNDGGETCGDGSPQVIEAFWLSCNTAFANIGIKIGGPVLRSVRQPVRLERPEPDDPAPGLTERRPTDHRQVLHRDDRDRPARRRGDAAAGGHGRRGDRQPRHADEAVPGAVGPGARPEHGPERQPVGAVARRSARRWPARSRR